MCDVTWLSMLVVCITAHLNEANSLSGSLTPETKDYCQSEYFNVTCQRSDVILMEHAQYGRMRAGRCVSGSYGVLGCSVDVLSYFDRKCSGRKQCNVYIGDPSLHKLEPCSKDFTTYLEAKYSCLGVASGSLAACSKNHYSLLTPPHDSNRPGFIASASATDQGGIGTAACPWRIQVEEGQTIRFSLLSFGGKRSIEDDDVPGSSSSSAMAPPPEVCYEIGEIKEGTQRTTLSMCGGSGRESLIYTSTGYDVTLQLLSAEVLRGLSPFVIKYEVQGCRKLKIPSGSFARIDGQSATIRCNGTKDTWYVTCSANRWIGHIGNCTNRGVAGETGGVVSILDPVDAFPYGILIVVAIGVALGVLIGGILLSVVAYYMRRRGSKRRYVTDDVMKQTTGSADDEDVYNHDTITSSSTPGGAGRLLVSHYNVSPHQYPLLQGTTVAYMPHHHHMHQHHHHQLLHQHANAMQPSPPTWTGETTAIEEEINDDADRFSGDSAPQGGTGVGGQTTCAPHTTMQMSSTTGYVVGRQTPTFTGRHPMNTGGDPTIGYCGAISSGRGQCGGGIGGSHLYESPRFK